MAVPELPAPNELERICKGLAALDAIVCEDWDSRYYSFNAAWGPKQRMASMRNGSGDEWFLHFSSDRVFFKAFFHEHRTVAAAEVYAGLPESLAPQLEEPAFSMEHLTFGGFHDGARWTLRGERKPVEGELAMLSGTAERYQAFALEYFELELPLDAIRHVLSGRPIDHSTLEALESTRTLKELGGDLKEIGYDAPKLRAKPRLKSPRRRPRGRNG